MPRLERDRRLRPGQRAGQGVLRKRKDQAVKAANRQDEPFPAPDVMAALERTLAEIRKGERKVPA